MGARSVKGQQEVGRWAVAPAAGGQEAGGRRQLGKWHGPGRPAAQLLGSESAVDRPAPIRSCLWPMLPEISGSIGAAFGGVAFFGSAKSAVIRKIG